MKKIASFCVNHDTLLPGIYLSRVDGDVVTYDIRMVKPNCPPYLPNPVMHTIEHLFATFARHSSFADHVIYFGPMGCRTGFYFLVTGMEHGEVIELIREIFSIIKAVHEQGITVLLVEQNAKMALSIADRAYVLETGRISMTGTGQELLNNENVKKAYLGA